MKHTDTQENARLIAAAPELLDALQTLYFDWKAVLASNSFAVKNGVMADLEKARAAIAKATGQA